jgi:hypothetical protein
MHQLPGKLQEIQVPNVVENTRGFSKLLKIKMEMGPLRHLGV